MYQALYRKWRPARFDDVVGQEHITEILKKQVMTGRLSHAFLFTGTRGTGKTTCAKILAKAVNCEDPQNGSPCGKCPICRGIDNGSVLDVTEMDAASNNGVDDVRALRDEAVYAPVQAKYRVYIIDEVHMLSKAAFNALLKIMEEPPEHLIFILATTELNKIPATILSRCQRYSFRRVPADKIRQRLLYVAGEEGLTLTEDAAELLSRLADGALRDALSLLDQCSGDVIDLERVRSAVGVAEQDSICELLAALLGGDSDSAVRLLNDMYGQGKDVSSVLSQLGSLCRDLLICRVAPRSGKNLTGGGYSEAALDRFAAAETGWLMSALELLQTSSSALDRSSDRRLAAELCLVKLCGVSAVPIAVPAAAVRTEPVKPKRSEAPAKPAVSAPKPEPKREPKAEEAPARETAPAKEAPKQTEERERPAAAAKPAPAGTDAGWEKLLAYIFENDLPNYYILSNTELAEGHSEGSGVTIYYKDEFTEALLADLRGKLEKFTKTVLGSNASLRIRDIGSMSPVSGGEPAAAAEPGDRYNGLEEKVKQFGYEIIREER